MSYPLVKQPENIKVKLFPHQLTAIYMMEEREENHNIIIKESTNYKESIKSNMGIFSDIVGYGKTLSVIGVIARNKMKWDINTKYEKIVKNIYDLSDKGIIQEEKINIYNYTKINTTLIVVNNSLINQWEKEIKNSTLSYFVVKRSVHTSEVDITNFDIILVSSKMYNSLVNQWKDIAWKRFIFDEPQHTKIPAMSDVVSGFYWLISATPSSLYYRYYRNSYNFITSIFNTSLEFDTFNSLILKNDDEYVKESYVLPKVNHIKHECYQPIFNMVSNYVDQKTLSLISAGDISGAVERLGGNETSNIVELIKKKKQNRIELLQLWLRQYPLHNNTDRWKDELEKLIKDIDQLQEKFDEKLNSNCSICMDVLKEPILITCCQNIFCGSCLLEWMKNRDNCPLCRSFINNKNLIHITKKGGNKIKKKQNRIPTKPEMIIEILNNNKDGKFILFSQYDASFENITKILSEMKITFTELKGHSSTISKKIKEFNDGKIKILYLNSNYNGAGINLQIATDIILYHEMSNDLTTQIIGRANRIGRHKELYVHHLV